jgi:hypothetical protein
VPVIGDGLIAQRTGIATAGLIVCIALAVAVLAVLVSLVHDRTTQPPSGSQRPWPDSDDQRERRSREDADVLDISPGQSGSDRRGHAASPACASPSRLRGA